MTDQQNLPIGKINNTVNQLNCKPNFEVNLSYPNNMINPITDAIIEIPIHT